MYIMIRGVVGIGGRGARKSSCNRTMTCSENMTSKNRIINRVYQAPEAVMTLGFPVFLLELVEFLLIHVKLPSR